MGTHDADNRLFAEVWPLHAVRYALVALGVLLWLIEHSARPGTVAGGGLLCVVLLLELPLHGTLLGRYRVIWAALQLVTGAGAFSITPGLPTILVLAAVLCGLPLALSRAWVFVSFGVVSGVTVVGYGAPHVWHPLVIYALATWAGYQFSLRMVDRQQHAHTIQALEDAQERVARFAETTRELAVAEERQHLAEELHDTLGHALVATLLQVQVARRVVASDPQAAEARLAMVEQDVRRTLERVRGALRHSRHVTAQLPLPRALESLAADFEAAGGPKVALTFHPDQQSVADVSDAVADVLYRTTQEALTNAVRHGEAKNVRIEAEVTGRRLYVRIADDGQGADSYTPGMGLAGMVSRVQSVGGTLRFLTAPGKGFQVEVGVQRR